MKGLNILNSSFSDIFNRDIIELVTKSVNVENCIFSKNYIFTGKVDVGVAVGAALTTLLVAVIIVVVGYWIPKFKSKESGKSPVMSYECKWLYTVCVYLHFKFE